MTIHLEVVPRTRIFGVVSPLLHTSSESDAQKRQFYLYSSTESEIKVKSIKTEEPFSYNLKDKLSCPKGHSACHNIVCTSGYSEYYAICEMSARLEKKNQLDSTECFIALIICSTCFGHFFAHHQELETIYVLLPAMVCDALVAGCRRSGTGQPAMRP